MILNNSLEEQYSEAISKILIQWEENLKKYEAKYENEDSIHWYLERTNVGALATAVWMAGGVAIEEYSSKKNGERNYSGRNDLYFHIDNIKAVGEAKLAWIKTGAPKNENLMVLDVVKPIGEVIANAESDISKVETEHEKFAIAFINTYHDANVEEEIEAVNIIEKCLSHYENLAVAKFCTSGRLESTKKNVCTRCYLVIAKR
jgi:hypothetical protein